MDRTQIFIKKCFFAKEIQQLWQYEEGDFYFNHRRKEIISCGSWFRSRASRDSIIDGQKIYSNMTWLPRQDQLQCLLRKHSGFEYQDDLAATHNLVRYSLEHPEIYSMEQLWLAFAMKIRFQKVWNGENWIDQNQTDPRLAPAEKTEEIKVEKLEVKAK